MRMMAMLHSLAALFELVVLLLFRFSNKKYLKFKNVNLIATQMYLYFYTRKKECIATVTHITCASVCAYFAMLFKLST